MAYYVNGYQQYVPTGHDSRQGVAALQQQMNAAGANLRVDGIWGPKTNTAYASYAGMGGMGSAMGGYSAYGVQMGGYGSTDLNGLYQQVLGILNPPTISYDFPSRAQLAMEHESILRPAYDNAIAQRQKQTLYNRAEIDVDAASRGMGRSSYVSDMKDRAMDAEAADVARMEGEYAAAVSAAVQEEYNRHLQNKLAADQYNASARAAAQNVAFGYATNLHQNNLSQAQSIWEAMSAGSLGGGSGKSSSGKSAPSIKYTSDMLGGMDQLAWQLYNSCGSKEEAARLAESIRKNKTYDNTFASGASEYISGFITGLR